MIVVDDHSTDATRSIVAEHTDVILLDAPDLPEDGPGSAGPVTREPRPPGSDACVRGRRREARARSSPRCPRPTPKDRRTGLGTAVACRRSALRASLRPVQRGGADGRRGRSAPVHCVRSVMVTDAAGYRAVGGHRAVRSGRGGPRARPPYCNAGLPTAVVSCDPDHLSDVSRACVSSSTGGPRTSPSAPVRSPSDGWRRWWPGPPPSGPVASPCSTESSVDNRCRRVVLYVAVVVQVAAMFRRCGRFGLWDALLLPVHLVLFVTLFSRSVWRTMFRRRVTWRGRDPRAPIVGVRAGAMSPRAG